MLLSPGPAYARNGVSWSLLAFTLDAGMQSGSSSLYPTRGASSEEQEQTSSPTEPMTSILEEPIEFLGEPNPARDSLDFELPCLPPGMLADSFMDLMQLDTMPHLGLLADVPTSVVMPAAQQPTFSEDSSILEEMMDWDGLCASP